MAGDPVCYIRAFSYIIWCIFDAECCKSRKLQSASVCVCVCVEEESQICFYSLASSCPPQAVASQWKAKGEFQLVCVCVCVSDGWQLVPGLTSWSRFITGTRFWRFRFRFRLRRHNAAEVEASRSEAESPSADEEGRFQLEMLETGSDFYFVCDDDCELHGWLSRIMNRDGLMWDLIF